MSKKIWKFEFDIENMWGHYKEFALTPALVIYLDNHHPTFYCISFQWFGYRFAITYDA